MDLRQQFIYDFFMSNNVFLQRVNDGLHQWFRPEKSVHHLVAIIALSMGFEYTMEVSYYFKQDFHILAPIAMILSTFLAFRAFFTGIDKYFPLIVIMMAGVMFNEFRATANHAFLCLWLLIPLAIFPSQISNPRYSDYVRMTLGIVMTVAAIQKIISGNYLNGVYFKHLSTSIKPGAEILEFLCFGQELANCHTLTYLSIFVVAWQFIIGLCLLFNFRYKAIIWMEIFFVLGVGAITDEMNFQAINVTALMLAFHIRLTPLIFTGIMGLLLIDWIQIHEMLEVIL